MAKGSGLGMGFYISGVDVSGDVGSFGNISGGNSPLLFTGIDKFAFERQGGKRDGAAAFNTFFNVPGIHATLKTLPTADAIVTGRIGSTIGFPAFSMTAKQLDYNPKRAADGSLLFDVNTVANGFGLQWGDLLTAGIRTDTTATNGPGFDTGAVIGAAGYQMYVHLLAFTGTSVTIKLQDSDDNGGADPFSDNGATLTFSTAPNSGRAIGAPSGLGQFIRVVTTGTFSNAQFVVMVDTNRTATVF